MGIFHKTSSPHHPKANAAAEAAVKTFKGLLAKTSKNGSLDSDAFRKGIIELRNTPQACGLSPAQIVFGHPMRSNVVTHHRAYRQEWKKGRTEADQKAATLRAKAKKRHDEHAKRLPVLKIRTVVRVQHPVTRRWSTIGEIIDQDRRARSYTIKTESGRVLWRNRRFLRLILMFYFPFF